MKRPQQLVLRLWLSSLACCLAPFAHAESLAVRLPAQDVTQFRGAFNYDRAQSGPSPMLYPGVGGLLGLFVGVATHAAIVGGVRDHQRTAAEAAGVAALEPYRTVLESIRNSALMRDSLASARLPFDTELLPSDGASVADWRLDIAPVFWFSTDQRALVLEADIAVAKGASGQADWQQRVWVVSRPLPADALPQEAWNAGNGSLLKQISAGLLGMACELAMARAVETPSAEAGQGRQRTVRYWEGGLQQIERAEVVAQDDCGRTLIRTLRNELMSVPTRPPGSEAGACER